MDPGWFVHLNIRDFDRLISLEVEESDIKCEVNVYLMGVAFDGYLSLFESQITGKRRSSNDRNEDEWETDGWHRLRSIRRAENDTVNS